MYTSMLLVALTGLAPSAEEKGKALAWSQDYTAAGKQAAQAKKPLAVFLAPGKGGYAKIGRDGLGDEAQGLLGEQYVCVHIDTATDKGKELAQAFQLTGDTGIIISDRTGEKQAFRHSGDLARADLVRYLKRYGDPDRVFTETESNPDKPKQDGPKQAPPPAPVSYPVAYGCGSCGDCGSCGTCGSCGGCGGGRHHRHGHCGGGHHRSRGCGGGCR
jgi:hypothetical protein